MSDLYTLYRQEFSLYASYRAGRLTKEEYLDSVKPLDKAIEELEMAMLRGNHFLEKASLQHFQRLKH